MLGLPGDEQSALGLKVVLHVGVEVEVVLGEVGEGGDREADPIASPQRKRMRGDLHRAGSIAPVEHPPEGGLEVDRLRGRSHDLLGDPADDPLHRSQQPRLGSRRLEQVANQERGRGLAVCAGDADDTKLGGRIVVEANRGVGHRRARVGDLRLGDERRQVEGTFDHQRLGAGVDRKRREVVPVARLPGNAEEQRSALHPAAVVGEPGDLDVGVARDLDHVRPREQVPQLHRRRLR